MPNKQLPDQRPHVPEGRVPFIVKFLIGKFEKIAYLFPTLEEVANGVLFSSPNEDNTQLTAQLPGGRNVTIPFSTVLMIEEYTVKGNFGGNGTKTTKWTGEEVANYTKNCGGEAKNISKITDNKGNVVFDRDDGKEKRLDL